MIELQKTFNKTNISFEYWFEQYSDFIKIKAIQIQEGTVQTNCSCIISILELIMVKIFTSNYPKRFIKILKEISNQIFYQQTIQEKDFELIRRIVYSKKVKELILELNKIKFKDQTDQSLNEEIEELLKTLSKPFYVSKKESNYFGLTCLNGQLIYSEDIVNYEKQGQYSNICRALLIVTYIHEVFFHLKRIKYCHNDNVLQSTPPRYSSMYNQEKGELPKQGEAGYFFEYAIFGQSVKQENCSQKLAAAILNPEKWEDYKFKFSPLFSHSFVTVVGQYNPAQMKSKNNIKKSKQDKLQHQGSNSQI